MAQLPVGSNAQVQIRVNPAGGYFIDFALPNAAGALTQAAAEALFAKLLPEDGTYRVVTRDGSTYLEVWNPDQEKYQTVVIKGAPGHESIAVEAADA